MSVDDGTMPEAPMHFRQFYLGCLAHASYLIGSDGEAAVVDPQRDVEQYVSDAEAHGFRIRYVIETHLHADFVSGHRELATRTGAEIVFGARAEAEFPHRAVRDGDELRIGRVVLRAMETPGHTPESVCWLVIDEEVSPKPVKVLTGDSLFIGDVGRPDLAGARGFTPAEMAAMLYDSIHGKLLPLDDAVEVWPAHGAGSACGRNIGRERSSTIGEQRRRNYALRPMSRDEFVGMMTGELAPPPAYFMRSAEINRKGARALDEVPLNPLSAAEVWRKLEEGAIALDVRDAASFGSGHLPRAINIGLTGEFASWAGSLVSHDARIVIVSDGVPQAEEATMRLARVGLENVEGYLDGGLESWEREGLALELLPQLDVIELRAQLSESPDLQVVDVRRPGEYATGHVPGAVAVSLQEIATLRQRVDLDRPAAIICAGGYRSSIGASILKREGFTGELFNVIGGTAAWSGAGFELEQ
jgi:glyoxylase-like metal-dependent hydrolase (beta-lactamase superfamily II)/rhodanese-related sulfurtransferase